MIQLHDGIISYMPVLPAICQKCGAVFPSGYRVDNVINTQFVGNTASPCPRCGSVGRIPDGTFTFVDNAVEVIRASNITTSELQSLIDLVNDWIKDPSISRDQVTEEIRKRAPVLAPLLAALPHDRNEWYAFLTLLATLLTIWLTFQSMHQPPPPTIEIFNQVIQTSGNKPPFPPLPPP